LILQTEKGGLSTTFWVVRTYKSTLTIAIPGAGKFLGEGGLPSGWLSEHKKNPRALEFKVHLPEREIQKGEGGKKIVIV